MPACAPRRQNIVEAFVSDSSLLSGAQDALKGLPDLERILKAIQKSAGTLQDVVALYTFTARLAPLCNALAQADETRAEGKAGAEILNTDFIKPFIERY
jgi:DNA mismatch repair ATPase MutS